MSFNYVFVVMTKKVLIISFLLLLSAISISAQRIQVVDGEGMPIAFVTATTPDGKFIASSDMDGWFENLGGNTTVHLSQIAYKPLTVVVADIVDGKVMLEEASYDLPDVVVKPKGLLYCQTYYRLVYLNEDGPLYYRGGVIDNTYDIAKKKVSAKSTHLSKGRKAYWRGLFDMLSGQYDEFARLPEKSYYDIVLEAQKRGLLTLTDVGNGRQIIADSICQLGYIYWDADECTRTISFDIGKWKNHVDNTAAEERKARTIYQVYRTDYVGNSRVDDFVMSQYTSAGRHKRTGMEYILLEESFATDYAYIDKKEFRQLRNDNKVDKSIEELLRFEKVNKIPPLAPNLQTAIDQLFKKDRTE